MPIEPPKNLPQAVTEAAPENQPNLAAAGEPPDTVPVPPTPELEAGTPEAESVGEIPGPKTIEPTPNPVIEPQVSTGEAMQFSRFSTGPLEESAISESHGTIPLFEVDAVPVPPLQPKTTIGERYRVDSMLGALRNTNLYRVTDLKGYSACWACGSSASMEGDTYCVECGAQLTGRNYRLQEFNLVVPQEGASAEIPSSPFPLPEVILENAVPGVAHIFDKFLEPTLGRAYIVWEETYGRTMAAWAHGNMDLLSSSGPSGHLMEIEDPEEEQILTWMVQAAGILAELHERGIVNCDITANNLVIQPGDRLVLVDPADCKSIPTGSAKASAKSSAASSIASDVRRMAIELESWYLLVRGDAGMASDAQATSNDATGPLTSPANPVIVLTRAREGDYATAREFEQALNDLYEASRPIDNMQLWSGRASDVGRVRQSNEDSVLTLEATILEHEGGLSIGLYVIADGMGGHQSGEVASSIAVRTIGSVVNAKLLGPLAAGDPVACDPATCSRVLQEAVLEANRRIADLARERHSDLGTTVTVAVIIGNQICVANVGDSRTYLWRDNQLAVITRDHSLVAQLVAAGQLTPDEIYTHPRRNEIYRALGDPRLTIDEVDAFSQRLQPGDNVLLCSDGLWDFVRDPVINTVIKNGQSKDPQSICQALIDRANKAGGEDNISTIVIRVLAPDEESKK